MKRVQIFVSEFGKERLKEEDSLGPQELRRRQEELEKEEEDYLDLIKSGKKVSCLITFKIIETLNDKLVKYVF